MLSLSSFILLKLMAILEGNEHSDVIGWLHSGRDFFITDKKRFEQEVMPNTKYSSFTRKLRRWDFSCKDAASVRDGIRTVVYAHPLFIRGDYNSCKMIFAVKQKRYSKDAKLNAASQKKDNAYKEMPTEKDDRTRNTAVKTSPSLVPSSDKMTPPPYNNVSYPVMNMRACEQFDRPRFTINQPYQGYEDRTPKTAAKTSPSLVTSSDKMTPPPYNSVSYPVTNMRACEQFDRPRFTPNQSCYQGYPSYPSYPCGRYPSRIPFAAPAKNGTFVTRIRTVRHNYRETFFIPISNP